MNETNIQKFIDEMVHAIRTGEVSRTPIIMEEVRPRGTSLALGAPYGNPCSEIALGESQYDVLSCSMTVDTLTGSALDKFAADYFGMARTPGYPDDRFREDLKQHLVGPKPSTWKRGGTDLDITHTGEFVVPGALEHIDCRIEIPLKEICVHEWRTDQFFTASVYHTCKKCGAKKEDL